MIVSVVLCTYRRAHAIERNLEALAAQAGAPPFEVLVVDNDPQASAREASRRFEGRTPRVLFVAASTPRNLPAARNEGIARSAAPVVAFLDDDSVPSAGWVAAAARAHAEEPDAGAIGGRVLPLSLHPDAPGFPGDGATIGRLLAFGRFTGNFHLDPGRRVPVDTVTGCNMTFKRAALERVGPFDPTFIGTTVREETDWCARARRRGVRLLFDPRLLAWHGDDPLGGSRPERGEAYDLYKTFWDTRNGTYFLRKNASLGAASALGFCAVSVAAAMLGRNFFRRFGTPRARLAAVREVVRGFRDGAALPIAGAPEGGSERRGPP